MALTQSQPGAAVADRAGLSKNEAKGRSLRWRMLCWRRSATRRRCWIGGLVQLTVRVKPAAKARTGRNPATGEEITIAAKPASVDLRARPLARANGALPSVQKARCRLAA